VCTSFHRNRNYKEAVDQLWYISNILHSGIKTEITVHTCFGAEQIFIAVYRTVEHIASSIDQLKISSTRAHDTSTPYTASLSSFWTLTPKEIRFSRSHLAKFYLRMHNLVRASYCTLAEAAMGATRVNRTVITGEDTWAWTRKATLAARGRVMGDGTPR